MSIATDIKAYAETATQTAQARLNEVAADAVEFVEKVRANATAAATTATDAAEKAAGRAQEEALGYVGKANVAFAEAYTKGESLLASTPIPGVVSGVETTVEPYFDQAKALASSLTEKAEKFFSDLQNDPRVVQLVETAESVAADVQKDPRVVKFMENAEAIASTVIGTVNEMVIKPVLAYAHLSSTETTSPTVNVAPTKSPTAKVVRPKPVTTAAAESAAGKKAPGAKATAKVTPAKKAPAPKPAVKSVPTE